MRLNGIFYILVTTLVLLALAVLAYYNFPFELIMYITLGGQVLLFFTVYKVLTDDYTTNKTFDDWYEDHPIGNEEK